LYTQTYAVDKQVSDSSSTATAFLTGVKTNHYTVGVTAEVATGNCESSLNQSRWVDSVFVDSYKSGEFVSARNFLHTARFIAAFH